MSFRTLQLAHAVLNAVQVALATDKPVDVGVFGDFNGGLAQLAQTGREPSDHELSALTTLGQAITGTPSEAESSPAPSDAGEDAGASSPDTTVTGSGAGEPAPADATAPGSDALFGGTGEEADEEATEDGDSA